MKNTRIILFDIIENGGKIVEPIGMASITSVLRNNKYSTFLCAYNENNIPYDNIIGFKPDLIGLSIQPNTLNSVFNFCRWIKSIFPSVITVIGGYLSTYYCKDILHHCNFIDIAVRGEGEYTFRDIANAIEEKKGFQDIPGITYMKHSNIIENVAREPITHLDELPFPSRDVMSLYNIRLAQVEGSRGCNSFCEFCSLHNFWTNDHKSTCPSWRAKSVIKFIDEIEILCQKHNIDRFTFLDCSFENPVNNEERIRDFTKEILNRNLQIYYYINARSTFYKIADEELMELLIKSGLSGIFLGAESFYEPDLKLFGKPVKLSDNIAAVNYFKKYPINLDIGLINFHPYTTFEGLRENLEYLKESGYPKRILYYSKLTAYRGTQLYQKIVNDKLIDESIFNIDKFSFPQYKFINPEIQYLYKFIKDFVQNLTEERVDRINYFGNDHLDMLIYLKRKFLNTKGEIILIEYSDIFDNIMQEYINKTYTCFLQLIELAEKGWDQKRASKIVENTLSYNYLINYVKTLEKNKMKLLLNLSRINDKIIRNL